MSDYSDWTREDLIQVAKDRDSEISKLYGRQTELELIIEGLKAENARLKQFERERWESAAKTLGIGPKTF